MRSKLFPYLCVGDFLFLLYVCLFWWHFPFLIFLFLVVAFIFLNESGKSLSILSIFPKEPTFGFNDLLYCFFFSISFISALILMISFLLFTLGFVLSLVALGVRSGWLFTWDFPCFLRLYCYKLPSLNCFCCLHGGDKFHMDIKPWNVACLN